MPRQCAMKTPTGQSYTKTRGEIVIMIPYSGSRQTFTVFGRSRYQEVSDKKYWKRFQEFLADRLK
jgi:hypothetical protein